MQEILTAAASTAAKDSNFIKEVYEDTLQPTAKNVGQALELTYGQLLSILFNKFHNNFYFQLLWNFLLD